MAYLDLDDHPFSNAFIHHESGELDSVGQSWINWVNKAERLFGHDLDGNDVNSNGCGYSLDEAFDMFCSGKDPLFYVKQVKLRTRYANK